MNKKIIDKKIIEPNKMDKEIAIQFIRTIFSALSHDPSMSEEVKQKILVGALLHVNLTPEEIKEEIQQEYMGFKM